MTAILPRSGGRSWGDGAASPRVITSSPSSGEPDAHKYSSPPPNPNPHVFSERTQIQAHSLRVNPLPPSHSGPSKTTAGLASAAPNHAGTHIAHPADTEPAPPLPRSGG